MNRWLKSLRRNRISADRKWNRVFVKETRSGAFLVVTHEGSHTLAGPFDTALLAQEWIDAREIK